MGWQWICLVPVVWGATYLIEAENPSRALEIIRERQEAGRGVPVKYDVEVHLWWAAWGVIVLGLVALGLWRWAAAGPVAPAALADSGEGADGERKWWRRGIWASVLVAMGLAGWWNAPRLDHSLWGDEEFTMRRSVVAKARAVEGGGVEMERVSWLETAWGVPSTNNHFLYSVLARLVHDGFFEQGEGEGDRHFSERLLRMPAYVAGLLALGAGAWGAWVMGLRAGALLLPWVMVFHPWYTRYAVDARGYSLMLLLTPLVLGFAWRAARRGRGWDWACLGLCQALLVWGYLGSLYLVVTLQMMLGVWLLWGRTPGGGRSWWAGWTVRIGRYGLANLLSLGVWLVALLPAYPGVKRYMERSPFAGEIDAGWLADAGSSLLAGLEWSAFEVGNPFDLGFGMRLDGGGGEAMVIAAALVVLVVWAVAGGIGIWRRAGGWVWVLAFVGAPTILIAQAWSSEMRPFVWYVALALPCVFLLWGAGAEQVGSAVGRLVRSRGAGGIAGLCLPLLALLWLGHERNMHLRAHPVEPLRESVALCRRVVNWLSPGVGKDAVTLRLVHHTEGYDPWAVGVEDLGDLREVLDMADGEGLPVFLNVANLGLARAAYPEVMAEIEEGGEFEGPIVLWGLQAPCTRYVWRREARGE
jgi:hypothetical protein